VALNDALHSSALQRNPHVIYWLIKEITCFLFLMHWFGLVFNSRLLLFEIISIEL
jgi:hypothetical protein